MQALHWLTGLEELNKKPEAGMASGSLKFINTIREEV